MARVHGSKTRVWVDGFKLTADTTNLDVNASIDVAEVTVFGDDRKSYIVGQEDIKASYQGLFDPAAGTVAADELNALIGGTCIFTAVYGTTDGRPGWGGTANPLSAYAVQSPLAGAVTISAEFQGPLHPMVALVAEGANSGNGANNDLGSAGSNNGIIGVLQCEGVTSGGTIKIEHSTTGAFAGEESDLINFGSIPVSTRTAVYVEASGTVRRYLRAVHDAAATTVVMFRRL